MSEFSDVYQELRHCESKQMTDPGQPQVTPYIVLFPIYFVAQTWPFQICFQAQHCSQLYYLFLIVLHSASLQITRNTWYTEKRLYLTIAT